MKEGRLLLVCIILTVATLVAFWPVTRCDFVSYDDNSYVTQNPQIQNGITIDGIIWAFTTGHSANWHPLTWMSHMMDVDIFGLQPWGHHLTNLLFHIANTLMLFFVLRRMTKALWQSAFVAALFAFHPLHVESVAWVAERKDVLSAFFWMLTMVTYVYYAERPGLHRYLAVLLCFALGLMAKPMLVTLPFVLLLLDYWPLERFMNRKAPQKTRTEGNRPASVNRKPKRERRHAAQSAVQVTQLANHPYKWAMIRPLLLEKIPLFSLAVISCIVTYLVQQHGGAMDKTGELSLSLRIANAALSYVMYIAKMFWPSDLAVLYPYPGLWSPLKSLGAALLVIGSTLMVIKKAKRFPYLALGWLWYAGTLVPVIGIVQVGSQAMADRYTYIPLVGLFIMAAWGIPEFLAKWRYRKEALIVVSVSVLLCSIVLTRTQAGYWQNNFTLYGHALNVTGNNSVMYTSRGSAYGALGNFTQAIADFDRAIEINPNYAEAYYNRGTAHLRLGNYTKAIKDCDRTIEINPSHVGAFSNRGASNISLGNYTQGIVDLDRAIKINPGYAVAFHNRGIAYLKLGDFTRAIADFDRAIEIDPGSTEAHELRAVALQRRGQSGGL